LVIESNPMKLLRVIECYKNAVENCVEDDEIYVPTIGFEHLHVVFIVFITIYYLLIFILLLIITFDLMTYHLNINV
jgi:hypothetical protein